MYIKLSRSLSSNAFDSAYFFPSIYLNFLRYALTKLQKKLSYGYINCRIWISFLCASALVSNNALVLKVALSPGE